MNATIPPQQLDALLETLYRGLVAIRAASCDGDAERAEAIADALHNLPHLLASGDSLGWTVEGFRELFLDGLAARYPRDHTLLSQPLDALELARGGC